jgi:D-3-phosphoglycerate dehydrogenase
MKINYTIDRVNVLLLEGIHPHAVDLFRNSGYAGIENLPGTLTEDELMERISDVHLLCIRSKSKISAKVLRHAVKLQAIGAFCIGTNGIDMATATELGIAVFNSPFSNTRSVAELVIAEIIVLLRRLGDKNRAMHDGQWLKSSANSFEARGKTLGIVGYGHIGAQVSVMAEALGMKVLFYDVEQKLPLGNAVQARSLDDLLQQSDVITLHAPGHPSTRNMINAERLRKMKPGALLINCSRGDLMDADAVREALKERHLGGLGLDVFTGEPKTNNEAYDSGFRQLENVFLTPHIGGSTVEAQASIGEDVASKLISYMDSGSTVGCLTVPTLNLPVQQDAHRLLHMHANVPGVMSEINTVLSTLKVNILAQYLKTNQQIGYVVTDIDKKTSAHVLDELQKVKHTIRVRSLY